MHVSKKAIIKMKNDDGKCFLWFVLRGLNPIDKMQNVSIIRQEILRMIWKCVISSIPIYKFEKQNLNICINVFGYEWNTY